MGFSMKVCGELDTTKNQTQYRNKKAQIQTNIKKTNAKSGPCMEFALTDGI